jgi:hypothetical protein
MSPSVERRIHTIAMLLGLPFAIAGAILPVNEYAAFDDGLTSAVDCDGPMGVVIFAAPALIFYASNAVGLFWVRQRALRWHMAMSLFCLVVSLAVLPNGVRALVANEHYKLEPACA